MSEKTKEHLNNTSSNDINLDDIGRWAIIEWW